jgi:hypothetical protein
MCVHLNTCVALWCHVGKKCKNKKGHNAIQCDLDLKNLTSSRACCHKQYNFKVSWRNTCIKKWHVIANITFSWQTDGPTDKAVPMYRLFFERATQKADTCSLMKKYRVMDNYSLVFVKWGICQMWPWPQTFGIMTLLSQAINFGSLMKHY